MALRLYIQTSSSGVKNLTCKAAYGMTRQGKARYGQARQGKERRNTTRYCVHTEKKTSLYLRYAGLVRLLLRVFSFYFFFPFFIVFFSSPFVHHDENKNWLLASTTSELRSKTMSSVHCWRLQMICWSICRQSRGISMSIYVA